MSAPQDDLLVPEDSEQTPTLSVVMPTLNEEEGIAKCIKMILNAFEAMDITGEIVVSDSSTDRTPEIAKAMGARVVVPDKGGYGYAYQYAFERTRGEYIAIGDADCTYDFEELPKLFNLVRNGDADMAMGSRLEGEILPGSMPPLHQHIGNPLLTKFLNVFYGAGVSDAHSGMRVMSRDALETLDLKTTGMEFASEMIMEAGARNLTIAEVPITYHPREGEATLESFQDGWRHVKFMLQNAPGYLFSAPGLAMGGFGGVVMTLAFTNSSVGPMTFGSHSLLAGTLLLVLGVYLTYLGAFASVASNPIRDPDDPVTRFLSETVSLERGAFAGAGLFAFGGIYMAVQTFQWAAGGFSNLPLTPENVVAFALMVVGVQMVFGLFLVDAVKQSNHN
ncbi:glycosyltransferase family 2 protein [Halogeometricum luteum]|uniref:glycosyltransferase family 2 protein n=1 Tax=Halogeometricum luteum TaxID=2950537 RepID=UPI00287BA765|nr:glycosyltransferase family 2 protein [Halogeometricum sp. S3BR5-2]